MGRLIDLDYPAEPAPLYKGSPRVNSSEMLPVCDEAGAVSAQASREFCHANNLLHPVVHLNIIDRNGKLLLQRRSASKEICPLRWDFAAAGHVSYGEDMEEALRRETAEEIGLVDFNPIELKCYILDDELVCSYAAVGRYDVTPDRQEVESVRLWTPEEITENLGKGVFTPAFEYEFKNFFNKLEALL